MKKVIATVTLGAALVGLSACSLGNDTLVETKSGNITKDDLYNKMVDTSGATALEQLIEENVLRNNYSVTNKEIEAELKTVKKQFSTDEEFKSALESSGIKNEEALKKQIELSLIQQKAVTAGVDKSEKKLKAYYEKHKEDFETAKASHILVQDEKAANEIKKKLDDGGDFSKLAKEYSIDTATASKGGDLGEFKRSDMVTEFSDAAFSIKLNTISDVIKTDYGYHIIKVTERKQKTYEQAKDQVEKAYLSEHAKSYQDVIKKLKKDDKVEIKDKDLKKSVKTLLDSATSTASTSAQ
ncbi:peptidylprolyl isomerase [Priestia megaterium]|uniref:Foldase protein PrsA n=1 Tax=Priestia megaterium TaxID=1404 RepID=A0A6M6E616_PRIMG|nr:peptidylprolyl isomerase [Priestia megaterium]QJX80986.1 peptidylprolyl isomerase PrsA [Priestia megaterium]